VWHTLVHMCRRWRNVVFGSQRHLNLRLCTTETTPVCPTLDIWPVLPIVVYVHISRRWNRWYEFDESEDWGQDNVFAALEHNDRICEIEFYEFPREEVSLAMQRPFPALTRLHLEFVGKTAVQPDSFLGGSAPRLQKLKLHCIAFRGLPNLLLSATHLSYLELWAIPHSGYFSPEAIVTALSVLASLKTLIIGFRSPRSYPNRHPPPQTRTLVPILTNLAFSGDHEYLEDVLARIDVPLLDNLTISFFHRLIVDTPQLTQLISHTPKFKRHDQGREG
jgi:hypothetical protein